MLPIMRWLTFSFTQKYVQCSHGFAMSTYILIIIKKVEYSYISILKRPNLAKLFVIYYIQYVTQIQLHLPPKQNITFVLRVLC